MTSTTETPAEQPDLTEPTHAPDRASRRRLLLAGAAGAATLLAVVLIWFQPQALLFDRVVDDAFPTAATGSPAPPEPEGDGSSRPAAAERPTSTAERLGDREEGHAGRQADDKEPVSAPTEDVSNGGPAQASDEAARPVGSDTQDTPLEEVAPSRPVALGSGTFSSRNRYTVSGRATIYRLDDGSRTLRLEDFSSTNGPDLFVYLAVADEADSDPQLDAEAVDLGVLRGNVGDQNYDIPADVDLDRYDTVVIWCRRFSTSFGAADLGAT
jgi:hypothetical protein